MKTVFVDTSGFYACLDGTDPFFPQARDAFARAEQNSWQLLTTNYVVHETWALVQRRLGWDAVDAFVNDLLPRCQIEWVDARLHQAAAARCQQTRERRFSFTDAVSLELMAQRKLTEAIVQDEHFTRAQIILPR
jgi:predicted nucleic acid-binding protein